MNKRGKRKKTVKRIHQPTVNFVDNLIDGMEKIILNCKALLTESNILFSRRKYGRAFVLAVFSG